MPCCFTALSLLTEFHGLSANVQQTYIAPSKSPEPIIWKRQPLLAENTIFLKIIIYFPFINIVCLQKFNTSNTKIIWMDSLTRFNIFAKTLRICKGWAPADICSRISALRNYWIWKKMFNYICSQLAPWRTVCWCIQLSSYDVAVWCSWSMMILIAYPLWSPRKGFSCWVEELKHLLQFLVINRNLTNRAIFVV